MFKFLRHQPLILSAVLVAGALCAASTAAWGEECWVDVYDQANFQGNKARIAGPAELADLKQLNREDWSNRIESLEVGPDAEVVAFRKPNFEDKPQGPVNHPEAFKQWGEKEIGAYQEWDISFGPGSKEHHLGELHFHKNINSIKIRCRK